MNILILGHSSIAQRRVIPALCLINDTSKIDIASQRPLSEGVVPVEKRGQYFNSYQEAIEKTTAGLVYISLLNSGHAEWAEKALKANKHVVVDKPAFLSFETAKTLTTLARQKGLCLAEATVFTAHPQIGKMKGLFEDRRDIKRLSVIFSIPPLPVDNFRNHKEYGGGAFWDLSAYAVATSRVFFDQAPVSVHAEKLTFHAVTGVDTAFSVMMAYANGKSFLGHYSFDSEYLNQINVFGPGCSVYAERIFTTPPEMKNEFTVKKANVKSIEYSDSGDAFEIYFKGLIADIKQNNFAKHTEVLLEDATLTGRLLKEFEK